MYAVQLVKDKRTSSLYILEPRWSQINPKEVFHNTAYPVQLPYIAGHSL